jgi:hypothetical protein
VRYHAHQHDPDRAGRIKPQLFFPRLFSFSTHLIMLSASWSTSGEWRGYLLGAVGWSHSIRCSDEERISCHLQSLPSGNVRRRTFTEVLSRDRQLQQANDDWCVHLDTVYSNPCVFSKANAFFALVTSSQDLGSPVNSATRPNA